MLYPIVDKSLVRFYHDVHGTQAPCSYYPECYAFYGPFKGWTMAGKSYRMGPSEAREYGKELYDQLEEQALAALNRKISQFVEKATADGIMR